MAPHVIITPPPLAGFFLYKKTAVCSGIFELVTQVGTRWNQLIPELKKWMRFGKQLKTGGFEANWMLSLTTKGE